nr:ABC transporter permease [uncultured Blautia sp.]
MLHLIKYNLLVKVKNFATTFWPLIFPLLLGTMFYFAFGNIDDADFETVQVGIVKEEEPDTLFLMFLDQVENNGNHLIAAQELSGTAALAKLENEEISGIYYVGKAPSLTVAANGIPQSILQSVLTSYETGKSTIRQIVRTHPSGLWKGIQKMLNQQEPITQVSLGGHTINGTVQFFYALIAMTCLYGCFIGFGSAITLQANITALAARRCVTPTHKLKLILSEQIASFLLGYFDVIVLLVYLRYILKLDFQGKIGPMLLISFFGSLIGVSIGIFVGSLGKMKEGVKIGIILGISMICSFLSGLMNNTMKDIVEKNAPFINRINPAALISDAFYCINVYDDLERYYRNLITLAVMSVVLVTASFLLIRRENYDSI